jgi:hypothetical protein
MSGTNFEDSEKLDILIKEQFQVTSTNENTPWYLETNVNYNTYTNGKDILIDEFNVVSTISQNWWATVSKQTSSSSIYSQYDLTLAGDFATDPDAGIYISPDGMLQRFEKIKLEYINKSDSEAPPDKAYSYTKITSAGNILTNSFQKNFGDGFSFKYNLYPANSSGGVSPEVLPTSYGGNWFFAFKSGIVFIPDPQNINSITKTNPPFFSFTKYVGRKGISELIKISSSQPSYPVTNQILLNTTSNKLQLFNGSKWDDYGGGGTIYTQGTGITINLSNVISIDQAAFLNLLNLTSTTRGSGDSSTNVATTAFVQTAIANLIDSAPSTLDTLNELAAALNDDANFSTTITTSLATKLNVSTFTAHPTYNITTNDITNWNTAYGWGDHSLQGYLTSTDIGDVLLDGDFTSPGIMATDGSGVYSIITDNSTNWNAAYGWGDHSLQGYLTSTDIGDVLLDGDFTSPGIMATDGSGVYSIITDNSTNWNAAYGWGDHSLQGYLTSSSSINDLVDVNTSGALSGEVLSWNGSNWTPTNITISAGSGINGYVSYFTSSDITSDYTAGLAGLTQLTSLASFGNTVTYNTNYFTFSENGKYKISIYGLFRTTDSSTTEPNAPSIYLSYSINNGTSWTSLANVLYLKNVAETNSIQKPFNSLSSNGIIEVADYSTFRIRVNSSNFGTGAKCSYFRIDFMNINPIFDANPSLTWTRTGADAYFTGGNVGIGTNNPTSKLEVNGTSVLRGQTTIDNVIFDETTDSVITGTTYNIYSYVDDTKNLLLGYQEASGEKKYWKTISNYAREQIDLVTYNEASGIPYSATLIRLKNTGTASTDVINYVAEGSHNFYEDDYQKNGVINTAIINLKDYDIDNTVYSSIRTTNGGDLQFFTNGGSLTEKITINNKGAIGIGGTDYGTAGDVIISNGPNASVSYRSVVYLAAYKTSNTSVSFSANSGTTYIIRDMTIDYMSDAGSYNTTTGEFTAPRQAMYVINYNANIYDNVAGGAYAGYISCDVKVDRGPGFVIEMTQNYYDKSLTTENFTPNLTYLTQLNAGDKVINECSFFSTYASTVTIRGHGTSRRCTFQSIHSIT